MGELTLQLFLIITAVMCHLQLGSSSIILPRTMVGLPESHQRRATQGATQSSHTLPSPILKRSDYGYDSDDGYYSDDEDYQSPAEDRFLMKPWKFPFWDSPHLGGAHGHGGYINPALFPIVPGGHGNPSHDAGYGNPYTPGMYMGTAPSPFVKPTAAPGTTSTSSSSSQGGGATYDYFYIKKKKKPKKKKYPKLECECPSYSYEEYPEDHEEDCSCVPSKPKPKPKPKYRSKRYRKASSSGYKRKKPCKYGYSSGSSGGCKPSSTPAPYSEYLDHDECPHYYKGKCYYSYEMEEEESDSEPEEETRPYHHSYQSSSAGDYEVVPSVVPSVPQYIPVPVYIPYPSSPVPSADQYPSHYGYEKEEDASNYSPHDGMYGSSSHYDHYAHPQPTPSPHYETHSPHPHSTSQSHTQQYYHSESEPQSYVLPYKPTPTRQMDHSHSDYHSSGYHGPSPTPAPHSRPAVKKHPANHSPPGASYNNRHQHSPPSDHSKPIVIEYKPIVHVPSENGYKSHQPNMQPYNYHSSSPESSMKGPSGETVEAEEYHPDSSVYEELFDDSYSPHYGEKSHHHEEGGSHPTPEDNGEIRFPLELIYKPPEPSAHDPKKPGSEGATFRLNPYPRPHQTSSGKGKEDTKPYPHNNKNNHKVTHSPSMDADEPFISSQVNNYTAFSLQNALKALTNHRNNRNQEVEDHTTEKVVTNEKEKEDKSTQHNYSNYKGEGGESDGSKE